MKIIKYILLAMIIFIGILMNFVSYNQNPNLTIALPIVFIILMISHLIIHTISKVYETYADLYISVYRLFIGSIGLIIILLMYILNILKDFPNFGLCSSLTCSGTV